MQQYNFQIDHPLIKQERQKDNIIVKRSNNEGCAVIYFSSNGIYFPNDKKTFKKIIMQENKFEWTNHLNRVLKSSVNIYVRDLYKQWYIKGINSKIDSIEKMVDHFKEATKGKKLITVGSSSGGYAATLFGILLNADYIFNFCGQFNLYEHALSDDNTIKNPLISKYRDKKKFNQYYDLSNFLKNNRSPIFYFYSKLSEMDEKQYLLVKDYNSIYPFGIFSDAHGIPFDFHDLKNVLNFSKRKLMKLSSYLQSKNVTRSLFTLKCSGLAFYSKVRIKNFIRNLI